MVKNPPANAGDTRDTGSIPGSGRFPWRRKWQPIPVFLFGKSHGQRSLEGMVLGVANLDTTEHTHTHLLLIMVIFKYLNLVLCFSLRFDKF